MQLIPPKGAVTVPEYEKVSTFYDFLMRHVQYRTWFEYVRDLLKTHLVEPLEVFEIACGAGRMMEMFCERGWRAYGMDISRPMLERARKRLEPFGDQAILWRGDMRRFSTRKKFSAVICLYDSINYCLDEQEFLAALRHINRALSRGGVFIFDVCTLWNCRVNFQNYTEHEANGDVEYWRHTYFNVETDLQYNDFTIQAGGASFFERHVQKMYSLAKVREMIEASGKWKTLGVYADFTKGPGKEKAHRVHFVLRKR